MGLYEQTAKIDNSHVHLIFGLIVAQKPRSVLEFGFGSGCSSHSITEAIRYNQNDARYVIVDNWLDYNGQRPDHLLGWYKEAEFVTSDEKDYVDSCKDKFDFILSDADHHHTDQWFKDVYNRLLVKGGILVYHDVTNPMFPNLRGIMSQCRDVGTAPRLFDQNSVSGERCDRGLLVIFK